MSFAYTVCSDECQRLQTLCLMAPYEMSHVDALAAWGCTDCSALDGALWGFVFILAQALEPLEPLDSLQVFLSMNNREGKVFAPLRASAVRS